MDTFDSHGQKISFEAFEPSSAGPHPGVVIAHGTFGLEAPFGAAIRTFAADLALAGYVALIPHYFERTGTAAATDLAANMRVMLDFQRYGEDWIETLRDALGALAHRAKVDTTRLGLVGFSMGGHLVLRTALSKPPTKVGALIDYFGPVNEPPPFSGLGSSVAALPPVMIHHGDKDELVHISNSAALERDLLASGNLVERKTYPGEGHGFSASAMASSTRDTIRFLGTHLA